MVIFSWLVETSRLNMGTLVLRTFSLFRTYTFIYLDKWLSNFQLILYLDTNEWIGLKKKKKKKKDTNEWCGVSSSYNYGGILKVVNSVPYRSVRSEYTVPASNPVNSTPLFRTGKNTGCAGLVLTVPANFKQYRPVQKKVFFFF